MSDELLDRAKILADRYQPGKTVLGDEFRNVIAALVARCDRAEADADRLADLLSPRRPHGQVAIVKALRLHDEAAAQR